HQHPDTPHALALLRSRHNWPRRRAAERDDKFSPPNIDCHVTLPRGSCNGGDDITPGRVALRDFSPANVGSGSFTSFPPSRRVRFASRADIRLKPAFMSTSARTARS